MQKNSGKTKSVFFYTMKSVHIGIIEEHNTIVGLFFGRDNDIWRADCTKAETPLIKKAAVQIEEWLAGKRKQFSLPLALHGTEFQIDVWKALQSIPHGETRSYKEIAGLIGRPKAARAVGLANNRNPIALIVPCHRVIGHNGDLVGFGGGLPLKRYLLDLEQQYSNL